ncbi:dnaJ homolog subfamily C member 14 [Synchiropus splendidus]|uniref:dnaJ homolog subfamily C member 14 n=1 Tax=Synchiropus splendidus TaxID=270530 RepID=UPI00237E2939|nr:dnaJ homolog subfamily C member 14 [Synchiropus splendidus]
MERAAAKSESNSDTEGDLPDTDCPPASKPSGGADEDKAANVKLRACDATDPAGLQDSEVYSAKCHTDESDGLEHESVEGFENSPVINQEEDEAAKEQPADEESFWNSLGKRCKLRVRGSAPEQRSQSPQSSFSSFPKGSLPSGSRHRQARRRNHQHQQRGRRRTGNHLVLAFKDMLSESLSLWCVSCIHMMIEVIVTLAHSCGVCVEAGVLRLHGLGQQLLAKVTDVPGMKADAVRILEWTKCFGADAAGRIVRAFHWIKTAVLSALLLSWAFVTLCSHWVKRLAVRLAGERGKRCGSALQNSRVWRRVASWLERARSWCRRRWTRSSASESPGRAGKLPSGHELERLLALAEVPEEELDPFTVLGVEVSATEAELKKAYRQLAVQVHPDKNKHPRAGEAFKVLRAAWDVVSNPEMRQEYELKRMAATELSKSMNEFLTKLQDDLKEAMNTMMCTKCEGKHKRFEMDREPAEARFCAECNRCHGAEEGDLWAESSMLGLRITYFACMDGKVYDITEWAGCQRIGISPDTHRVPYHISFGSKNNSTSTRHRNPPEHPTSPPYPTDLHDFFSRIFKGGGSNDMAANGGFFPSGCPPPNPAAAGVPPFSPPPGQTGFFPPGSHRPESSETPAEGGKPPRRKRKLRKPFQR